eukprot:6212244-Pleurochrysis_carterae.AAC.8
MADWLEAYSRTMDLNFWSSTRVTRAVPLSCGCPESDSRSHGGGGGGSGNGGSGDGTVRDGDHTGWLIDIEGEGRPLQLSATHLVFATGMSGYPRVPQLPGADEFEGVMMHSSQYCGGRPFRGKRAVVIGANTSAHDIAQARHASQTHGNSTRRERISNAWGCMHLRSSAPFSLLTGHSLIR